MEQRLTKDDFEALMAKGVNKIEGITTDGERVEIEELILIQEFENLTNRGKKDGMFG